MPRPNWFFAFPLDGAFVQALPALPGALRLYHPDDVHLTLAFLGGCGEEGAMRALAALDARLALDPPGALEVSLGEVVPMGGSRRSYSALSALLGAGREARPAKPHITIARPKRRATDADRQAGLAWAEALDLSGVQARLDRIALFTWSERRVERLFRIVAERRLA